MHRSILSLRITPSPRVYHFTARRSHSVVLSSDTPSGLHDSNSLPSSSSSRTTNAFRERRFNALLNSLSQETPDSSDVWTCYVDFTHNLVQSELPLDIHQKVLRRCLPHPSVLRPISASRMRDGAPPRPPHVYEARLKTVIQNIRLAGEKPSLEDYHFILEQFAAVGHYTGSMQVFSELKHVHKLCPEARTFTLCIQSIAHRLSLPMYKLQRARIVADAMSSCRKLLDDFKEFNIPLTSVFLDSIIRILKETADEIVFSQLMKAGYGIDLDYPDRPESSVVGAETQPPLPFSTHALNTTLDMIGRTGNLSRLVQTFEVLTQPLPPQASQHYSSEFDDDDDDFGVVNPALTYPHRCPSAAPNTTTYCTLLKYISRAGHVPFARHYLLQAFRLDRQADRALRKQLSHSPDAAFPVSIAVNRRMILSVFGLANRSKDVELMRFVGVITRRAYQRKTNDIRDYSRLQEKWRASILSPHDSQSSSAPDLLSTSAQPLSSLNCTPEEPETDARSKPFSVSTHLQVLRNDLKNIASFYEHEFLPANTRTFQRVKERLGRRVWNEKDIYLRTLDKRTVVAREEWTDIVNYKNDNVVVKNAPRFEPRDGRGAKGKRAGGWRGLSTMSALGRSPGAPFDPPLGFCKWITNVHACMPVHSPALVLVDRSSHGTQAPKSEVRGKLCAVDTTAGSREM